MCVCVYMHMFCNVFVEVLVFISEIHISLLNSSINFRLWTFETLFGDSKLQLMISLR